jgi:site-specific DNA recombinase
VAENFPDAISDSSVNVEVLRIERTFWEKATSDIKKISNNLLTQQDVETAMTTFDPIWESMTLRDQIRLVQVVVKQVDYDGESGRVTITFNPIGIKRRAEHATKDLEEARA